MTFPIFQGSRFCRRPRPELSWGIPRRMPRFLTHHHALRDGLRLPSSKLRFPERWYDFFKQQPKKRDIQEGGVENDHLNQPFNKNMRSHAPKKHASPSIFRSLGLMATRNPGSTHQLRLVVEIYHYLEGFSTIQTVVFLELFENQQSNRPCVYRNENKLIAIPSRIIKVDKHHKHLPR